MDWDGIIPMAVVSAAAMALMGLILVAPPLNRQERRERSAASASVQICTESCAVYGDARGIRRGAECWCQTSEDRLEALRSLQTPKE